MKLRQIAISSVAAILLVGCGSSDETSTSKIDSVSDDALAKVITVDSLASSSKVYINSANTEILDENYTYNYSKDGGIIAAQKIDWSSATSAKSNIIEGEIDEDNLEAGYEEQELQESCTQTNVVSAKPIPKVICDSQKELCMVYNITCLTTDVTVAVTPYLSKLSMPSGASFVESDNKTPIIGISADVSVQNANGEKLSIEESEKAVALTAKLLYKGSEIENIPTETYTLYQVQGLNKTESKDITVTNATTKVKTDYDLTGFYPYIVAKAATFTSTSGDVKLGENLLNNANILILDKDGNILTTVKTNDLGAYNYKVLESTEIAKLVIYSDLLKNGKYEVTDLASTNIVIPSENLSSSYPTLFTTAERTEIKDFTGDLVFQTSPTEDQVFKTKNLVTFIKPAYIYSSDSTKGFKQITEQGIVTTFENAINAFLKEGTATNTNGSVSSIDYTVSSEEGKSLEIKTSYVTTVDVHNYNVKTTLTINKNDNGTFEFSFNKTDSTTTTYGSKKNSDLTLSWIGTNENTAGTNVIQTVTNGKHSESYSYSYASTSSGYESYSQNENNSESSEFYIKKIQDATDQYSTSITKNISVNEKYGSGDSITSEVATLSLNAKQTFTNTTDASYTNNAIEMKLNDVTFKKVDYGETTVDLQNVNIEIVKNETGDSIKVNGIDASQW